jgi:SAM-dependent methyltransferase
MTEDEIHKMAAVEHSHWWYRGTREICFSMLVPRLPARRPLRMLDVGCGTGGNLVELAGFGEARGVDIDPLCLEYCRRRGLACEPGSLTELHAADGSLDLITTFDVLTQADRSQHPAILRDMHRALAPGGLVAFREPALRIAGGAHDRAVNIRHRYTRHQVVALLRDTGFEPLRVTCLNTLLFPLVVAARRLGDLRNPDLIESDVKPAPAPVNAALLGLLRIEKALLRITDLPFGVSVFAIGRKPVEGHEVARHDSTSDF